MNINDNRGVLIIIAVVLIGIFAVILMEANKKTSGEKIGDSISDIVDSAGDGTEEFREEVVDEIDDNTDSR